MRFLKAVLIFLLSSSAISVFAQQGRMDPDQMAKRQTDSIKHHVTAITTDQEAKILTIERDFAKSGQAARTSSNGDHSIMRTKMDSLRKGRDEKIKGVLTADQYTQYTQMPKEHAWGGGGGHGKREDQ